jgi:hypothetical protein
MKSKRREKRKEKEKTLLLSNQSFDHLTCRPKIEGLPKRFDHHP